MLQQVDGVKMTFFFTTHAYLQEKLYIMKKDTFAKYYNR